jgi:hypothetical protein
VDHLNALLPRLERAQLAMSYFFLFAANARELKQIKELRILNIAKSCYIMLNSCQVLVVRGLPGGGAAW